ASAIVLFLTWMGSRPYEPPLAGSIQRQISQRDRDYLLRRLHLRYEQVFRQSLQGEAQVELDRINLELMERPAAIQNALSLKLHLPEQPDLPLPPQTSIVEVYQQAQRELLILGEPGAGKSTLLLELALHLVHQAEHDATHPFPILLPLSSWANNRRPLHEWFAKQMAVLYQVPQSLCDQLLKMRQVIPLLDGLDEMEASAQADCVTEINTYHRQAAGSLQPLVVCSRTNEYKAATTRERLALHTA